ncbi:Putative HAD-hydrolase YfnB [Paenibacillus plantiphilus]|uniref:HAD-hydrolase YfnB n=1 Tax=Paenibacillus plantiphilus TaxID=2905650 RepID=A0ABM9CKL5_9BACL|nr:HAD family hydrolase [Paenibacillus plantiphilus]CAH1215340.1 Putative HAD-hydrolase YfnB [Paenibacillus plantiphilus]
MRADIKQEGNPMEGAELSGIKLLLFDIDDTLYDFGANWEEAVSITFAGHELTCALEHGRACRTFNHYSELRWEGLARGELTFQQYRHMRLQDTLEVFGLELSTEQSESFTTLFISNSLSLLRCDPAVKGLLEKLSRHYALGVISNGAHDTAREKLAALGLKELFSERGIVVSGDVGISKPNRAIFELTLDRLGYKAAETLFVGDSWPADIVGAMEAGLSAVWLNPKGKEPLTEHRPFAVIADLSELEAMLL